MVNSLRRDLYFIQQAGEGKHMRELIQLGVLIFGHIKQEAASNKI
jgi:hypothetical protein